MLHGVAAKEGFPFLYHHRQGEFCIIPDYQTCMLPLLKYVADNKEHKLANAVVDLSIQFRLETKGLPLYF